MLADPFTKALEDIPADDAFWAEVETDLALAMLKLNGRAMALGIEAAGSVGVNVDFDGIHAQALEATRRATFDAVKLISNTTKDGIREVLINWQETGAGVPGQTPRGLSTLIAALRKNPKLLDESLEPLFGKARAKRIAVTESTRLFAEGNRAAAANDPAVIGEQWQTANDEIVRQCAICWPKQGKVWPKGQGPAMPAHVNCRCSYQPVTLGWLRAHANIPGSGATRWQGGALPEQEAWEQ